ncbi:quinone-dependent dihydroorotate dehydrogenase [Tunicatimonas pelagia]|uniref:quinone-dependent dihydroorotate dehydrogenase n=1 Tax=Tunicatimonas pelagia TaxID=931531 RepID=UPI00266715E6|nr:quinone-dependent dihydroorotate dehydrogenase [Tunicatimonas pelagia]WKN42517.1 quinone-dependent dihydroorotate dehydrogenase [Tunicatimonas pelagia]
MYKSVLRPLLFLLKPEQAHKVTVGLLRVAMAIPPVRLLFQKALEVDSPSLTQNLFGLEFKNPVGLAAGFDKDAKLIDEMAALGFGFVEIGTLTPHPQAGNPQPRLFRLPQDSGLINRMGFNNGGIHEAAKRLARRKSDIIVGGNIGKNKTTPNENATDDYEQCFELLFPLVDYFTVNVSSPNTPDLRQLQEKEPLFNLLNHLKELNQKKEHPKPILLKIAPDLNESQLDDIIEICLTVPVDGIIATNTTISRESLQTNAETLQQIGAGGLSGSAIRQRSTEVIRYIHQKSGGKLPIIGVGGIGCPNDALEKLEAGASLVQIYTGYIYEGPALVRDINRSILTQHTAYAGN